MSFEPDLVRLQWLRTSMIELGAPQALEAGSGRNGAAIHESTCDTKRRRAAGRGFEAMGHYVGTELVYSDFPRQA